MSMTFDQITNIAGEICKILEQSVFKKMQILYNNIFVSFLYYSHFIFIYIHFFGGGYLKETHSILLKRHYQIAK